MTQSCMTVPAAAITGNELSGYQMPSARRGKEVPEKIYSVTICTGFLLAVFFKVPIWSFKINPSLAFRSSARL